MRPTFLTPNPSLWQRITSGILNSVWRRHRFRRDAGRLPPASSTVGTAGVFEDEPTQRSVGMQVEFVQDEAGVDLGHVELTLGM